MFCTAVVYNMAYFWLIYFMLAFSNDDNSRRIVAKEEKYHQL